MSNGDELYCRLCAEVTPKSQLISPDEDVAISSKVAAKLLWINIDISSSTSLPNTICFSCFDLLERTWSFLHNTRAAQQKLMTIFSPKQSTDNKDSGPKHSENQANEGKPVDENWEAFQELKKEIKLEVVEYSNVKSENDTDDPDFIESADFGSASSDSDIPLMTVSKAKSRKKCKARIKNEKPIEPLPESVTWDKHMCRCAKCEAQCDNMVSLQVHSLEIHNCCCVYKCLDCDKVVHSFKAFVKHVRTHNEFLQYCCEYCNTLFTLTSDLRVHKTKHHSGIFYTKCKSCGAEFDNVAQLQDHKTRYRQHKKSKLIVENDITIDLKCKDCNKEFKSKNNLRQHRLVHEKRTREFSCHVCGKMFFTKGTLGTHLSTHEDTKPFKCPYCPLAFRARGNLTSHVSLHSGIKPFVCEQCGKSFRVKRHLKSHSIVHTDLMPYVCDYCNKSFRFKTRLNLHLRQHTGAKPYKCVYCQRDFTNGSNFKKHMKRRHGIDTSKEKVTDGQMYLPNLRVAVSSESKL